MEKTFDRWLTQLTIVLFHFGAVVLPLVFGLKTEELFEFNKMLFVYAWAAIVGILWLARMIVRRQLLIVRTPFDIPILFFIISQLLSTLFSINPYTSLYGYYSRFHGGLLSTVAYVVLFYVFVSVFFPPRTKSANQSERLWDQPLGRWLVSAGLGLVLASLYAFPEHFGYSPSCQLATGKFNVACWVQDVQNRVFGTFGQPNWLAAYLILFIPVGLAVSHQLKTLWQKCSVGIVVILWYVVLLFTKSRSGLVGLIIGLAIMAGYALVGATKRGKLQLGSISKQSMGVIAGIGMLFALLTLQIGTPLSPSLKELFSTNAPTPEQQTVIGPALEVGGTESGTIRKIVWQGALDVWKRYPILGSGLETFAYSYYQSRPIEHNLVSEWDFLYNKAHNEWLNVLANSGAVGFAAFLSLIGAPFLLGAVWLISDTYEKTPSSVALTAGILGGLAALHVSNFFGFSTVAVTTMQFLFMGILVVLWKQTKPSETVADTDRQVGVVQYMFLAGLAVLGLVALGKVLSIRSADVRFATGKAHIQQGQISKGSEEILSAIATRPQEASYYSTLGNYYANIANQLYTADQASQAAVLADQAQVLLENSTQLNPVHYTIYLTKIGAYMQLGVLNDSWLDKAMENVTIAKTLAPTDPRPWLMEGKILAFRDQYDQAITSLQKAIELKPNYLEARSTLAAVYELQGNDQAALDQYHYMLENINPDDSLLKEKIASLEGALKQMH